MEDVKVISCSDVNVSKKLETTTEPQWDFFKAAGFFCGSGTFHRTTHTFFLMEPDTPKETAAPGDWEITNDSAIDATVDEEQEENESLENRAAKETLKALDDLPSLMEEIKEDRTNYDLNYKLVECLKHANMPEFLETAREDMHKLYPLTESMWQDWISDSKREATDTEGIRKVMSLYERASEDYLSIPIWKSFVEYVLELFDNRLDNKDRVNRTRANLKKAVNATRWHISQSQEIWNSYIQFQVEWLEHLESPTSEQLDQVMQDYLERLGTLHTDHESTFSQYSTFNTKWDNANYEKNMLRANKVYSKTKAMMNECDHFELKLAESGYSLAMFCEYIEVMKLKEKSFLNYTQNLYERAVALYCTDVALWDDYIVFLLERARIPVVLESVTKRAIRNCPWSGVLLTHHARSLEARDAEPNHVLEVFKAGTENKTLMASQEDIVALYLGKCDYLRRRIDLDVEHPGFDERGMPLEPSSALRSTILDGVAKLQDLKTGDPYFRLERYATFVETKLGGDLQYVRGLWEKVVNKFGKNVEAWLAYIQFERSAGDIIKCESLFKRAIAKQPDDPERLMHAWLNMEHEVGSLSSMQDALVRINKKTKMLTQQWQAAYAMEEAKQGQEWEKALKEKQKKAQHRLKLKQNRKQARLADYASRQPAKRKADDMDENAQADVEPPQADTDVDITTTTAATTTTTSSSLAESSHVDDAATTTAASAESSHVGDTSTATTTENDNAPSTSPSQTKRRRIETNQDETTANRSGRTGGRGRGRGRGYQGPTRLLGRGIGRAGRLAMPSTRPTPQNQDNATASEPTESASEEPAKPKSQDDFRAMLLGKK
ncbi:squamous cell carcinoma antigen recognized by t-cells 3-like [Lichtheimia corymbifera JMRC:FSU:9682]|uniref:Squamous cell carcinoma antigen recognized by t-cells 3-like n=1 Tax=Lichtheimia corymbifera JMRC:FSU:9682 TaxID=1263082 RepID=A0A068S2I5_9FUNG|nr:squamous cell carcinoma antigen recognized by t-cells 3-like [Lichtheimia corymbifera JMRC:FSU:9682]